MAQYETQHDSEYSSAWFWSTGLPVVLSASLLSAGVTYLAFELIGSLLG